MSLALRERWRRSRRRGQMERKPPLTRWRGEYYHHERRWLDLSHRGVRALWDAPTLPCCSNPNYKPTEKQMELYHKELEK